MTLQAVEVFEIFVAAASSAEMRRHMEMWSAHGDLIPNGIERIGEAGAAHRCVDALSLCRF